MFVLPFPLPSFLYNRAKLFPGNGGSSSIAPFSMSVLTISNLLFAPFTALLKLNTGTSSFVELNLYCSVGTPATVSFLNGRPNVPFTGNPAFNININCSYQSGLEGSFQSIA